MPRSRYRFGPDKFPYFMNHLHWIAVGPQLSKRVETDEMMWQKIEYIHNNPLRGGYVDDPVHWRYSSARVYAAQAGVLEVCTDWRSLEWE